MNNPRLMGILNVTPDSFSDGGRYGDLERAVARAEQMASEGADVIDIGGESTRPGAEPVPLEVELTRVIPVVKTLSARFPSMILSVDTRKAEVARQSLEEGARMINDVSALSDPWMPVVLRDHDVPVILMHMQGDPSTMQNRPTYTDVVNEIMDFFQRRVAFALERGLRRERLLLDPGIGFGKTTEHNLEILRRLREFKTLNCPLVVGLSLKSFIGKALGSEDDPWPVEKRAEGTLAAHLWAAAHGADVLRVHDVAPTASALGVWNAIASASGASENPAVLSSSPAQGER